MRPQDFSISDLKAYNGKAAIYTLRELLKFPPPTWLMEGLLPEAALTGLVGEPGIGKSMVALDWALCVATGVPWLGIYPVQQGFALYIAAEGHSGLSIRAAAWQAKYGHLYTGRASFGLVKDRLFVTGVGSTSEDTRTDYETLFDRIEDEMQSPPKLVIIDTLARCLDGNENEGEAMGHFIDGAEQFVERYRSTVVVVHHKNALGGRERGHSSFRGAISTLHFLDTHKSGLVVLKTMKQRDAKELDDVGLRQEPVEKSALFVAAELPAKLEKVVLPTPMRKADMLAVLGTADDGLTFTEWRLACQIPRRSFARRLRQLVNDGEIVKDPGNNKYVVAVSNLDIAELEREDD